MRAPTTALAAMLLAGPAAAQAPTEGPWKSVIVRDGDTVTVPVRAGPIVGLEVRLLDVDAPETKGRCAAETTAAARATERLRDLTRDKVRVVTGLDVDAYGRLLGRLWTRDHRDVSRVLLDEGLVRPLADGEKRRPWCP